MINFAIKKMNKNTKRMLLAGIALIIVFILVACSVFVYYGFYEKENKVVDEEVKEKIDDRISPLCTQGLIIEINRIRCRGIVDVLMKKGTSWRETPQFYYIAKIDDVEQISKDVAATAGAKNEQLFNTWDAMFMENKMIAQVQQEQEKSDVTISIMKRVSLGILGRRYQDEEQEKIQLTYDFKTGRWTGDDSFNDSDGYGHYLGQNFEVWFDIYQTDNDHDYIPYWTEVNVLHTDPNISDLNLDPDNDGIPTAWEWKWGYDPHVRNNHTYLDPDHDGLTNVEEYQMEKYFANPYHQDVYLEVDNMAQKNIFDEKHVLYPETAYFMTERYAQHNISLYIDNGWQDAPANGGGQFVPYYAVISQDSGMMLQYYLHYFPDERKGIFRYAIVANKAGFDHPSEFNRYDSMAITTEYNFLFSLGRKAFTPRTKILAQSSELMHELGHSMGIRHETFPGCDNYTYAAGKAQEAAYLDAWGNYRSCMTYYYFWDYSVIDYSDGTHGPGDNNDYADIAHNMSYFKQESVQIEEPPPIES